MKTKFITLALCALLCGTLLTGCGGIDADSKNYDEHANLIQIDGELYYYQSTGVVYIVFNECVTNIGYGYMSPYYSANGKLCRYDLATQSIVEIED